VAFAVPTQLATRNSNAGGQTSWAPAGLVFPAGSLGLLLFNNQYGSAQPTSVSDGTNSWTRITTASTSSAGEAFISIWYFNYVSGGTFTVTVSFASTSETFGWIGYTTGGDGAGPDTSGANQSSSNTTITATASGAMSVSDEISAYVTGHSVGEAPSTWPTANYSSLFSFNDAVRQGSGSGEYRIYSGAGSGATESVQVTYPSSNVVDGALATFKPAATAAAIPILVMAPPIPA
jgi:hypothetical protein